MAFSNSRGHLTDPTINEVSETTFVFFDTEATGLPTPGNLPKFTELCFLAVSGKELRQSTRSEKPRILQKLTLCFNPGKRLNQSAIDVSGLSNELLQDCPTFAEQAPMLFNFLKHLRGSVRLVVHSGDRFDFPLLVRHFEDAGLDVDDIPNVRCSDTFEVFRQSCPMRSYKLGNIYRQVCGQNPPTTHSAENDTKMLMDIVHTKNSPILFFALCHNSKPLAHFKCPPGEFCARFRN